MAGGTSTGDVSPTLVEVSFALGDRPVTPAEVILAILERHASDYAGGRAALIAREHMTWPEDQRRQPVEGWFREVDRVVSPETTPLHGRAVILGLALVDRAVGRACTRAGLFAVIRDELRDGLDAMLNDRGRERLTTIPLAATGPGTEPVTFVPGPGFGRIALAGDGRRIVAYGPGGAVVCSLPTYHLSTVGAPGRIRAARFDRDRRSLVAVLDDWSVRVWPLDGLKGRGRLVHEPRNASGAALSRDGSTAVFRSPSDPSLSVLDTTTGATYAVGIPGAADRVAISPAGDLIAARSGDQLHVVSRAGDPPRLVASVPVSGATTFDCASGQVLAAQDGSVLVVYGPNQGRLPVDVPAPGRMSLDGIVPLVAIGHLEGVTLVNTLTGVVLARLPAAGPTPRVTFSLDGRRLVSFHEGGEAQVWDVGLDPPPGPSPPATYAADVSGGERDLLGRNRDVEAFASLIAARTVEAPLSIGIFGDWGSGKSWFMRQLRARISEIAADARVSGGLQREVTFFKHIAQVEFNAWHYSESDVLASLVEHIFGRLDIGEDLGVVAGERARRVTELAHAERAASEAAADLDRKAAALAALEQRREEKERQRAAEMAALEASGDAALAAVRTTLVAAAGDALTAVGWGRVPGAINELRGELASAHAELSRTSALLAPLVQGPPDEVSRRRWQALVQLGIGPAVAVALGASVAAATGAGAGALAGAGGLLTVGVGGAAAFVRTQAGWVRARRESLEKAQRDIDDEIGDRLADIDAEILALRAQEAEARRTIDDERSAYESTKEKVEEKRQAVVEATPERMLEDLISATVRAGEYSRHLGVVAQARRDFEKVSDMIRAINADLESASGVELEPQVGINRIVLYIDDLDRCEPDKVAKVLQAVHLLLALPLFVVVVGVDSRWVARALRKQYPELLDGEGGATAHDYLEKIFQIPFWLDQLDPTRTAAMLRGLAVAGGERRPAGPQAPTAGDGPPESTVTPSPSGPPAGGTPARPDAAPVDFSRVRELNPLGLQLQQAEIDAMVLLAPVIGRSPRTVKRFVNVYRLIKVRAAEPLDFVDPGRPDSDHLVVAYLLAEVTGRRSGAAELFEHIRTAAGDDLLADVPPGFPDQCGPYKRWLEEVARFSFLDEHVPGS